MAITIDELELKIIDNSSETIAGLLKLQNTLNSFKSITGLNKSAKQIESFATSVKSLGSMGKLREMANGLTVLASVSKLKMSATLGNQIVAIGAAAVNLDISSFEKLKLLANSLASLTTLGKPQLTSFVTQLKKLPEVALELEKVDMNRFAASLQKVTAVLAPLANEMNKISLGFSALPSKLQRVITSNERLAMSNAKTGKSFGAMGTGISSLQAKFGIYYMLAKRAADIMSGWVQKSNDYVENINLFTVSMGQYAGEALKYAEQVQKAMGIDMSEWIRNQGIFMQMGTGFGVVADKAAMMSKGLTQISYDIASFFNIGIATALEKVQSGFAGELEPLRRLGYALDVATLQQIAYKHGISQSLNAMTQAQKSQLRYVAIMEQSQNVMGDMARTLGTPANAMRILGQATTQLTRALGNMFIPMLITIIPYVQAFVMALTEAAQFIASLFGFTLPTIDYSGMNGLSSGVENAAAGAGDLASGMGDAAKQAKKLKDYTLGFDELNILQPEEKATSSGEGGGGGGGGMGGGDLGIGLKDYDFLGGMKNKAKELFDSLKNGFAQIAKMITPWLPLIKGIGAALLTAFAVNKLSGFKSWFKGLDFAPTLLAWATRAKLFGSTFANVLGSTKNPLKALSGGLDAVRSTLSATAKAMLGIGSAVGIFVVFEEAVKAAVLGTQSWGSAIAMMSVATVGFGAVLYTALGPIGLVVAAIAAMSGAVVGYNLAEKQMREDAMNAEFYNGVGASITLVSEAYSKIIDSVTATNKPILENQKIIDGSKEKISSLSTEIGVMATQIQLGSFTATELLPQIESAFAELESNTNTILDTIYLNISHALAGSLGDTLTQMGYQVPEIANMLNGIVGDTKQKLSDLMDQRELLFADYNSGKITDTAFATGFNDLTTQISALTTEQLPALTGFNTYVSDEFLSNINFENPAAFEEAMARLGESAGGAKEAIELAGNDIIGNLEALNRDLADPSKTSFLDNMIAAQRQDIINQQAQIDEVMGTAAQTIQTSFGEKMKEIASKEAPTAWENFLGAFTGVSVVALVQERVLKTFSGLDESFKNTFAPYGKYSMEGYAEGLLENQGIASDATAQMAELIDTTFHDGILIYGSPSGRFKDYALWTVEGYVNGINENTPLAVTAMEDFAKAISLSFEKINKFDKTRFVVYFDYGKLMLFSIAQGLQENPNPALKAMNELGESLKTALVELISDMRRIANENPIKIQVVTEQTVSGSSKQNKPIKKYATGGFPEDGLFMANHGELVGQFSNGRTAVANNDQIVTGIAQGVYEAVVSAMAQQQERPIIVESKVSLDGNEIGRSVDAYNSNKGYSLAGMFANAY